MIRPRRKPNFGSHVSALLTVVALLIDASSPRAQPTLPWDFVDLPVVSGLSVPTNLAFLPDGRLLVIERDSAKIRLIVNGALAAIDPVGVVPNVRSGGERGLLGIAVDPGFPARPFVYVHYTRLDAQAIRIARFRLTGDLTGQAGGSLMLDVASRFDVLDGLTDQTVHHNGGTLRFGPDGMLYAALGDDHSPCDALDLTRLLGKILRLDVSNLPGSAGGPPRYAQITPADNPFASHPDSAARLVYAYGLRNPFSFHIDPPTGNLFIADVGEVTWEEIDRADTGGKNFGWPHYEGPARTFHLCSSPDTGGVVPPIYAYSRVAMLAAVIGGGIYRRPAGSPTGFPIDYEGDYFLFDLNLGFVRRLRGSWDGWNIAPHAPGQPDPVSWARDLFGVTSVLTGPDGALWYCQISGQGAVGEIRRVVFVPNPLDAGTQPADALFRLDAPSPSPARGAVAFHFRAPAGTGRYLTIFDALGRRVRSLSETEGGTSDRAGQRLTWDGRNERGIPMPSGVYWASLRAGGQSASRRFVYLP